MELSYYMIIITNLCIGITFLFSIILIIDELYNLGFFTFNYTYQYNYGSFISKFNNIQTIECETNRFNVYNNINFLFKDIFNKSYFNYLLIIVATLLTVLCCIAYGVYFYYKFIIEQPDICSYDENIDLSLPKQLLKCLCDECHKIIPNCTGNYLIVFIIIIIIPLSYILKVLFNINITPYTNSLLFSFLYICLFILLLFYYSFNLFNRKTDYKYKDLIIYSLFTIIFISSGYIFKYIYSKYTNINLNSSNDINTIYDIYKQTPPIKPQPIQKPIYKEKDLLSVFKYNEKDKDPEYKIKKTIVDDYFKATKDYDIDMKHYNERYNAYINSSISTKLPDKTNFFNITFNILGLNNYMHLYLLFLIIISYIIYTIYSDEVSYICFIYLFTLFIIITIMNGILYYNTCINKYIIYEPLAHYKNDLTNANTALNLELNSSSGAGFYNILINTNTNSNNLNSNAKTDKQIFEDIKKLVDIKYYTKDNVNNINKDIKEYQENKIDSDYTINENIKINDVIFLYKKNTGEFNVSTEKPINYLFLSCLTSINLVENNPIKIESEKKLIFKYNNYDVPITISMQYYYRYCYYKTQQYLILLNSTKISENDRNNYRFKIDTLLDTLNDIISSLQSYKDINDDKILNNISTNILDAGAGTITNISDFITNLKTTITNFSNSYIKIIDCVKLSQSLNSLSSIIYNIKIEKDTIIDTTFILQLDDKNYNYGPIVNKNIDINNFNQDNLIIKTTSSDSGTVYYQLPNKIIDKNNNEYYLKLIGGATPIKISIKRELSLEELSLKGNFNLISQYTSGGNINIDVYQSANKISSFNDDINATYSLPFNLYKKTTDNTEKTKFINIIKAVLFNNICNIQASFSNSNLLNKLKRQKKVSVVLTPANVDIVINKTLIFKYDNLFTDTFITDLSPTSVVNAIGANKIAYIVLLYNVYYASKLNIKKIISDNIKYLITNYDSIFTNTDDTIIEYLNKIIDNKVLLDISINNKINIKNDKLFNIYDKNIYIINIISSLLENLFTNIKTIISKSVPGVCLPPTASLITIENAIDKTYTITNTPPASDNAYTTYVFTLTPGDNIAITNINEHLNGFINIVKFLLNNLKDVNNDKNNTITAIKSGFNFYNKDDIVKDIIIRQLKINCDYFSKYNNLDTKQLSYFKMNSDNVNYNFPILMIIFLIVLGEPAFIKS